MAEPKAAEQSAPLVFERAEGVYIYDTAGRRYLDSQGGLWCVNVGHGREEVKEAISAQLDKLPYYTTFGDTSNLFVINPSWSTVRSKTRPCHPGRAAVAVRGL